MGLLAVACEVCGNVAAIKHQGARRANANGNGLPQPDACRTPGRRRPADATVTSTVGIGPRSAGGFGLDIDLEISLPGVPRAEAEALVEKAHQVCPYSNATRVNVDVRLKVA